MAPMGVCPSVQFVIIVYQSSRNTSWILMYMMLMKLNLCS